MRIYLVQHGISASSGSGGEKTLSERGYEETKLISSVLQGYKVSVAGIAHSGKLRARQTAEIFREILAPATNIRAVAGIMPLDDVRVFAKGIMSLNNFIVVGHLPFMDKLLSYLAAGNENAGVYTFQNSGVVCLAAEESDNGTLNWSIKWTVNPNIS